MDSDPATVTITVAAVNDAPSFSKVRTRTCPRTMGRRLTRGLRRSARAPTSPPSLCRSRSPTTTIQSFRTQPAVSSSGVLSFRPATSEVGSATVTVVLHDNGGTGNGGDDSSGPQTFTIDVAAAVNDPPSFTKGLNQSVLKTRARRPSVDGRLRSALAHRTRAARRSPSWSRTTTTRSSRRSPRSTGPTATWPSPHVECERDSDGDCFTLRTARGADSPVRCRSRSRSPRSTMRRPSRRVPIRLCSKTRSGTPLIPGRPRCRPARLTRRRKP